MALLAQEGVSDLIQASSCVLPSAEEEALDYLRQSGIEYDKDAVSSDKEIPKYEQYVYALLAIKYISEPKSYKNATLSEEAALWA